MNIITVQLQDYYQHKVFETVIARRHWSRFESRLRRNVDKTLGLLERHGVKATFFALGWIAERFPEIIQDIHNQGHEIASAGFWGADRRAVTQTEFREDMRLGKDTLEEIIGTRVDGYRSIRRSFSETDLWMIDLVSEEGYRYDSSLMPSGIRRTWGVDARRPFVRETRRGPISELPHSTANLLGVRVPVGGGNFLRQLPTHYTFRAFKSWTRTNNAPFMLYFHPWELDGELPDVSAFGPLTRVRQYRNLGKLEHILPRYLEAAPFGSARDYLELDRRDTPEQAVRSASQSVVVHRRTGNDRVPVTVVIPCYNEEAAVVFLSRTLNELTVAAEPDYDLHYVLVDDRSTDDTVRMLRDAFADSPRHTVLELPANVGVSGAIHAGIREAQTEIVCSIDADCSYDPLELLKMIPLLDTNTAMVTASPYHEEGAVLGVPEWRLFLSRGLSRIYHRLMTHKFATYTSCFRVYRRSAVLRFRPQYTDFRGIVELLALMDIAGENIKEFPTTLQSRIFGISKMRTIRTIRDHVGLLAQIARRKRQALHG